MGRDDERLAFIDMRRRARGPLGVPRRRRSGGGLGVRVDKPRLRHGRKAGGRRAIPIPVASRTFNNILYDKIDYPLSLCVLPFSFQMLGQQLNAKKKTECNEMKSVVQQTGLED